ncbi:hypothetical protein EWW49_36745, partial [Pseudomonas syringae]
MLNLNKFFLALAFLGGSAAVQAGDGRLDVARIEFSKTSDRLDRTHSWGHSPGEPAYSHVSAGALSSPPRYGSPTGTHTRSPVT